MRSARHSAVLVVCCWQLASADAHCGGERRLTCSLELVRRRCGDPIMFGARRVASVRHTHGRKHILRTLLLSPSNTTPVPHLASVSAHLPTFLELHMIRHDVDDNFNDQLLVHMEHLSRPGLCRCACSLSLG